MRRARPALGDDRGSVAAEFAVAFPAIALVLLLACGTLAAAARHVRLQDAAADAARLASRGEPAERVQGAVEAAVPGAAVEISERGDLVCATARARSILLLDLEASSCALAGGG